MMSVFKLTCCEEKTIGCEFTLETDMRYFARTKCLVHKKNFDVTNTFRVKGGR